MPRGRVLTEEIKKRIAELADRGLSNHEISGALRIDTDTVNKYRGEKTDVQQNKVDPGPVKTHRKRRHRAPSEDHDQKDGEQPCPNSQFNSAERIEFVGGKKHVNSGDESMSKDEKEEKEYECPKCHHQFNGDPSKCPKCGAELQE